MKGIEYMIQRRMKAGNPPDDGRGQGQPPSINFSQWKQFPKTLEGYAPDIRVAGVVVNKVIPEDSPARLHQHPHPVGQFLPILALG